MKSMIVVACLALACGAHASQGWAGPPANIALSQDGRNILDTPEVAQARAAHISALQQAAQNNPNPNDDGSYNPAWDNEEYWQRAEQNKWNAPAPQQWNAAPAQSWNSAPAPQWNAAPAPAWNAAGPAPAPVAETPEVAQARAAHLAALNAAKAAAPAQQWNAPAPQQWNAPAPQQWNAPAQQQWNAPAPQWNGAPSWQNNGAHQAANIQLARDGSGILETPEVAAARAAHLAAHQQAGHGAAPAHPQQHW